MGFLTVDFYKKSGKRCAGAHFSISDEEMQHLKTTGRFGLDKIYDFIRANQKVVALPDTLYWVVYFDGKEPFQFLRAPTD